MYRQFTDSSLCEPDLDVTSSLSSTSNWPSDPDRQIKMAAVGETINLLDPSNSSKNTLKLENVCQMFSTRGLYTDTMRDEKPRHLDSHREEISGEMEGG